MLEDLAEYRALVQKVTGFTAAVEKRRALDLACRRGCEQCCHVYLDLLPVEAAAVERHLSTQDPGSREAIRRRAMTDDGRCAMLDASGACAIYEARPIVCRTQGHALAYPKGIITDDALHASGSDDVTWCPLNYPGAPPESADISSVRLLEELVFVVNQRFASDSGVDPAKRATMRALARGQPSAPSADETAVVGSGPHGE